MIEKASQSKTKFIFLSGVLGWGGTTALLITLFNRYVDHELEPAIRIVMRFVIYFGVGILFGEFMWSKRESLGRKKPTRMGKIAQIMVFIALMLACAFVLWRMGRR